MELYGIHGLNLNIIIIINDIMIFANILLTTQFPKLAKPDLQTGIKNAGIKFSKKNERGRLLQGVWNLNRLFKFLSGSASVALNRNEVYRGRRGLPTAPPLSALELCPGSTLS